MAETAAHPYATHLDIKFDPLTLIDVSSLAKTVTDQWYNQTLCKVNESVIRLGVMQGEYHWHKHDNDDEFFFVLSGRFIIDLEARSIELLPNQGFTVPTGVLHCTRAPEAWWDLAQDERRAIFEEQSRHIGIGMEYLPAVARRLHHSRELGEPFDFLTWFEYAPEHADAFEELVRRLRSTAEWRYVEREVDIRASR